MLEKLKTKDKIAMLTAYDCGMARLCEEAKIDILLVGDSLAMVFQGMKDTKSATMEQMLYHAEVVARGAGNTPIVGDMPIHSYDTPEDALANARRFMKVGCHAVKVEGNKKKEIQALLEDGIPVMGHIGLLPQTAEKFSVQGKDKDSAARLQEEAQAIDRLGAFALVLECIPAPLAKEITASTSCKTLGIGAGPHCDGQVLVIHDMLGLYDAFHPKFARRYANVGATIREAAASYRADVEDGSFPAEGEWYG